MGGVRMGGILKKLGIFPLDCDNNELKDRLVTKYIIFELYNMYDMVEDEFGRSLEEEEKKEDENKEEKDDNDY